MISEEEMERAMSKIPSSFERYYERFGEWPDPNGVYAARIEETYRLVDIALKTGKPVKWPSLPDGALS